MSGIAETVLGSGNETFSSTLANESVLGGGGIDVTDYNTAAGAIVGDTNRGKIGEGSYCTQSVLNSFDDGHSLRLGNFFINKKKYLRLMTSKLALRAN